MEILAGSLPVGCISQNSHVSCSSAARASSSSASAFSSRIPSSAIVRRRVHLANKWRPGGFAGLVTPGRNFHAGCWRQIVGSATSGKHNGSRPNSGGGKGSRGGKGKLNQESKDDGTQKDNGRNAGPKIDKNSDSVSSKKKAKPSVWSEDVSSGKSPDLRTDGAGRREGRGGVNVVVDGRDARTHQSSDAAPSRVAASEARRKNQDVDYAPFLRYLSPLLPIEEKLLQPEEPVPNPLFSTFCSNAAGVWRGVGATFSPTTAEFEPIYLDEDKQNIYDVRVLSTVENLRTSKEGAVFPPEQQSLHRKVLWSLQDPLIENDEGILAFHGGDDDSLSDESHIYEEVDELGYWEDDEDTEDDGENSDWEFVLADPGEIDERWEEAEVDGTMKEIEITGSAREDITDNLDWEWEGETLPADGSVSNLITEATTSTTTAVEPPYDDGFTGDTTWNDVMEEDSMTLEPGLVFFEDGAFSRGPLELFTNSSSSPRGDFSAYTYRVEQCLVAGGHKRLRVVLTISADDGETVEVLRLVVFEEEWMGPCNMKSISDAGGHHLKLFSERPRHSPEDIVGNWKVFEVEGMAMHPAKASDRTSFVFYCKETSIKRGFPAMPKLSIEEDQSVDLSEFSMSWLTGNVSTYVSLGDTGDLTFGVGWICDDGTRLVMERTYGEDGKLIRVKSKSEIRKVR